MSADRGVFDEWMNFVISLAADQRKTVRASSLENVFSALLLMASKYSENRDLSSSYCLFSSEVASVFVD